MFVCLSSSGIPQLWFTADFLSAVSTLNNWHVLANSVMTSGCTGDISKYLDMGWTLEQRGSGTNRSSWSFFTETKKNGVCSWFVVSMFCIESLCHESLFFYSKCFFFVCFFLIKKLKTSAALFFARCWFWVSGQCDLQSITNLEVFHEPNF